LVVAGRLLPMKKGRMMKERMKRESMTSFFNKTMTMDRRVPVIAGAHRLKLTLATTVTEQRLRLQTTPDLLVTAVQKKSSVVAAKSNLTPLLQNQRRPNVSAAKSNLTPLLQNQRKPNVLSAPKLSLTSLF